MPPPAGSRFLSTYSRVLILLGPVPPLVGWGDMPTCRLAGAGQGGKGLPLGNPGPLAYADCREGPELRGCLHRPGATRHPWRDAPFYGHPDRAPAPTTPTPGPTDGFEFRCHRHEQKPCLPVDGSEIPSFLETQIIPSVRVYKRCCFR